MTNADPVTAATVEVATTTNKGETDSDPSHEMTRTDATTTVAEEIPEDVVPKDVTETATATETLTPIEDAAQTETRTTEDVVLTETRTIEDAALTETTTTEDVVTTATTTTETAAAATVSTDPNLTETNPDGTGTQPPTVPRTTIQTPKAPTSLQ